MRKRTWMDVGIAVLGLFLVCSASPGVAQDTSTRGAGATGGSGQVGGTQGTEQVEVQQWQEIAQLRGEVSRLQREVARMQAQLSEAGLAGRGVGGAGTAGTDAENAGTGGGGSAGIGDPNAEGVGGGGRAGGAQANRPDTSNQGVAVANIIHTGRVRSVSARELVLVDEGGSKSLLLANNVRVFRGREQVSLQSLREGTFVRASADLYMRDNPVIEIQVLPTQQAARE